MKIDKEIGAEIWLQWLQDRIPLLKDSANAFWVKQALNGCALEHLTKQAEVIDSRNPNKQTVFEASEEYKNGVI